MANDEGSHMRPRARSACGCASHAGDDHCCDALPADAGSEPGLRHRIETAVLRAMLPDTATRRSFLRAVGSATASAAIAQAFPVTTATELLAQTGPLEKSKLAVGFIPITCATPIIMAAPLGFYAKQGLNVEVVKSAGWAIVRDKAINKEFDAAHMLAPMPIAISMGLGSAPTPFVVPAIENVNGQAICLALKHKDQRDPATWKGLKFAIPFDYSNHNYLLRYYLAEHGIDPDADVQLRVVPPPEMVANLRAGNIDGFLAPDNIVQRAVYDGVGFIHILSKEIWDGHPCCAFAARAELASEMPNTYAALLRALIEASAYASKPAHRKEIAEAIATPSYLNAPVTVLDQVLTGTYADGLGGIKHDPDRVTFDPFPWESFAIWIMAQMKRWGQVKGDVDYNGIARKVFLTTEAAKAMKDAGLTPPTTSSKSFSVMGKTFDPAKPDAYVDSFRIKRA
jgi:nitrate/nitrite transport system substrate-binding protein